MVPIRVPRVRPKHTISPRGLLQPRPDLHPRTRLGKDALPHLAPAVGRVAVHARALRGAPQALLRAAALHAEEHRAGQGREQPREEARDVQLLLELEQVEERPGEDRGEVPVQLAQGAHGRERRRWARGRGA